MSKRKSSAPYHIAPSLLVTNYIKIKMDTITSLEMSIKAAEKELEDEYPYLTPSGVYNIERIIFNWKKMISIEKRSVRELKTLI